MATPSLPWGDKVCRPVDHLASSAADVQRRSSPAMRTQCVQGAEAGAGMRRKVTGNLKLVHEMYGPKNPLIPHEAFKRDFADAIASNEEIDKHFTKARPP